jgi:hypothetical protein
MTQLGHPARGSAASTVAETFYSRLLWRSRNSCSKLSAPYFGTAALSRYACIHTNGLRWPFAALLAVAGLALGGQAMGSLRQRRVLSSVTVKRRKSWLLAASALASSSLGISGPALAANECGPLAGDGSVTCFSNLNPYPTGITYGPPPPGPATQLHVTLNSDVNVALTAPGIGVALNNFGNSVPVLLEANGATINVTQVPAPSGGNRGLYIETQASNATITASGQIDVAGEGGGSHAIKAFVNATAGPGDATVIYGVPGANGQLLPGAGLSSSGTNSTVIQAESINGNARIDASGNLVGRSGNSFFGLFAQARGDFKTASVTYSSGTITIQGSNSVGIFAGAAANGSAEITTLPGTTINVIGPPGTPTDPGITAEISGTAAAGQKITVNAASTIKVLGDVPGDSSLFNDPIGIRALSREDAAIMVTLTKDGSITTQGGQGFGILALARNGSVGSDSVTVTSSGSITTSGAEAIGIVADSGTIYRATRNPPQPLGPGGNVTVTASGAITTQGAEAHGIWAASTTGTVLVNAFNNVTTTGQFSTGINAISSGLPGTPGGNVTVNVAQGVSVNGGWQDTGVGSSTFFALPAAGVILSSTGVTPTLINDGNIGALSDRAVAGDPVVINNGTITGFVQFTGGGNSIENNGLFDLRHFAQTTPNGGRDTVRVAIADLGEGLSNSFTNNGRQVRALV